MPAIKTLEDFLARTKLADEPHPILGTKCRLWTMALTKSGYGATYFREKMWNAQRVAWTLGRGEIPDGLGVLHKCDNRPCVNYEEHLFLGSHADNTADMLSKGRGCFVPIAVRYEEGGTIAILDRFCGTRVGGLRRPPSDVVPLLGYEDRLRIMRHCGLTAL